MNMLSEILGLWEQLENDTFNLVEFDQIKSKADTNRLYLSPTHWIKRYEISLKKYCYIPI